MGQYNRSFREWQRGELGGVMIEIEERRGMAGCVMKSKEYGSMAERLNQIRNRDPGDGGIKLKQPAGKWDVCLAHSVAHSTRTPLTSILSVLIRDAITFFFSNHHIHTHIHTHSLDTPLCDLIPLPLSAFSQLCHTARDFTRQRQSSTSLPSVSCLFFFEVNANRL